MIKYKFIPLLIAINIALAACSSALSQEETHLPAFDYSNTSFQVKVVEKLDAETLFFSKPRNNIGQSFQFYETLYEYRKHNGNYTNFGFLLVGYQDEEELPIGLTLWVDQTKFQNANPGICLNLNSRPDVKVDADTIALSKGMHEQLEIIIQDGSKCSESPIVENPILLNVSLDNNRDVKINNTIVGKVHYRFEKD